jgi:hypothetical protein
MIYLANTIIKYKSELLHTYIPFSWENVTKNFAYWSIEDYKRQNKSLHIVYAEI